MDTKAAFEKCATSNGYDIAAAGSQYRSYINAETETAWQIWKESWKQSREAIEIDLPVLINPSKIGYGAIDIGEALEYSEVVAVIASHGIRIKGKTE